MTSPMKRRIDTVVAQLTRKFGPATPPTTPVNREKTTKWIVDHMKSIKHATDEELREIVQVLDEIERRRA